MFVKCKFPVSKNSNRFLFVTLIYKTDGMRAKD